VIRATADGQEFAARRRALLVNFGASHPYPHGTRNLARDRFEPKIVRALPIDRTKDNLSVEPPNPYDALMWRQTSHRFSCDYYERLKRTQAVLCLCGELIPPMPFCHPERLLVGGNKAKVRRWLFEVLALLDSRSRRSVQWDSFRFWEAMAAGCATFNLDLDLYGADLPVVPENGRHYFGIDLDNVDSVVERLIDDPGSIERIGRAGREWAMRYYSPVATARRLLLLLGLSFWSIATLC
jgi:hypothetical protein